MVFYFPASNVKKISEIHLFLNKKQGFIFVDVGIVLGKMMIIYFGFLITKINSM